MHVYWAEEMVNRVADAPWHRAAPRRRIVKMLVKVRFTEGRSPLQSTREQSLNHQVQSEPKRADGGCRALERWSQSPCQERRETRWRDS